MPTYVCNASSFENIATVNNTSEANCQAGINDGGYGSTDAVFSIYYNTGKSGSGTSAWYARQWHAKFDTSAIPTGDTITSVTLNETAQKNSSSAPAIECYGFAPTSSSATWKNPASLTNKLFTLNATTSTSLVSASGGASAISWVNKGGTSYFVGVTPNFKTGGFYFDPPPAYATQIVLYRASPSYLTVVTTAAAPSYNFIISPRLNYQQTILASSPILYWRMNTASGTTVTDYSGSARNGTAVSSPTLNSTGLVAGDSDTAMTFNGSNQRVSLAYSSWMNINNISLEAIVKPTAVSGIYSIIDRDNSTSNPNRIFQFRINAGKFEVILWDSAGALWTTTGNRTLVAGQTYHLAATHDGTTTKLYVNGILDKTAAHTGTMQISGTQPFSVASNSTSYQFFPGVIDEVAWYSTVLSADTIAEHASVAGLF